MRRAFWVLLVISVFGVAFGVSGSASAQATELHNWDSNVSLEVSKTITYQEVQNRFDCRYADVKSISLKAPFTYMFATVPVMLNPVITPLGNKCLIDNQNGIFTNEFLQGSGDTYFTSYYFGSSTDKMYDLSPMISGSSWIEPAPATDMVLFFSKQSATNKDYIVNHFDKIGDARPGIRSNKLTWEFGFQLPDIWKDKNGGAFKIDEHAFSPNGQFMAIHYGTTIAKVNLRNMELTPVSYETGLIGNELAISNDGRYLAQLKLNRLVVADTIDCVLHYQSGAWESIPGVLSYEGCTQSQDIITKLVSDGLVGTGRLFKRPYFSSDSKKLNIGVGTRRTDIDTRGSMVPLAFNWQEVVLTANNHVSNVQGYLAMGDSFSSGEGDLQGGTWYEPGTDEQGNKDTFEGRNLCHLSRRSYPYLIAKELGYLSGDASEPTTPLDTDPFHSVACSGAVIHNILGGAKNGTVDFSANEEFFASANNQYNNGYLAELGRWQPGRIKQLDTLDSFVFGGYSASEPRPEVITLGIGGNDAGFGDTILACALPGTCKQAVAESIDASNLAIRLMNLKPKLVETYKSIKQASPESRVYVHGYPVFVSDRAGDLSDAVDGGTCMFNVRLDFHERHLVIEGVKYMNQIVRSAAQEAGVVYVDIESILDGTNLCSGAELSAMTVNGITAGNDKEHLALDILSRGICWIRTGCLGNESFHPNPEAHKIYSQRLLQETDDLTTGLPLPQTTVLPIPSEFFGIAAINEAISKNSGNISSLVIPEPNPFLMGNEQGLQVMQEGLMPGSTLRAELQSTPITIAEFTVPASGIVDQHIELPPGAEPGAHELHIFGTDNFGTAFDYYEPILLAFSETDFDGDGISDDADSCVTVFNSFVDEDQDGIDDACDDDITILVPEEETPQEVVVPEVLDREKGEPNPETVAGNEEIGPQVLGATTSPNIQSTERRSIPGTTTNLVNTGTPVELSFFLGMIFVALGVTLFKRGSRD